MKHLYQLKIEISGSSPKIWRSILVAEETTFSELHDIIQLSMGWGNEHLYEFTIGNTRIYDFEGDVDDGADPRSRDSMDTFLNETVSMVKTKFSYVYDFGDRWKHDIQLEKVFPQEQEKNHPVCLDGENACPPEDCGGIWRYQDMLQIISDKNHPEFEEIADWIGEDWDVAFFDIKETNDLLLNYMEQLAEIYAETGQMMESLDGHELDDEFYDPDEDSEYAELKKFTCPQDILHNEYERSIMEHWLETALEKDKTIEYQTSERLCNLGFDIKKANELILEALSIEWYYDLKYGTEHLEDRYAYNLRQLPETPLELPSLKDALTVLDRCNKGIPFLAIEYVQNDPSDEAVSAILKALRNHSDHQYCWADCTIAPFWYALAAEGHLCEDLIDPVIEIYAYNSNDSDWLLDQGQYLIGKLAEKFPDLTAAKVLDAMEKDTEEATKPFIFYLFDAFHFCDLDKYKSRLLVLLERDDLSWQYALTVTITELQIKEAIPVLKEKLKKLQADPDEKTWHLGSINEINEAIQILEGENILDHDSVKPISLKRGDSWQEVLKMDENLFYEEDDYDFPGPIDQNPDGSLGWPNWAKGEPFVKEKTPGRNDPCHCGSGKKYKKCCIDKDSKL